MFSKDCSASCESDLALSQLVREISLAAAAGLMKYVRAKRREQQYRQSRERTSRHRVSLTEASDRLRRTMAIQDLGKHHFAAPTLNVLRANNFVDRVIRPLHQNIGL